MKKALRHWMQETKISWFRFSHQGGLEAFLAYEDYRKEVQGE